MASIRDLPIVGFFDRQRFTQFNPADSANWYMVHCDQGKKKVAMYPTMGRHRIRNLGQNKFIFAAEPRGLFKSIDFVYVVVVNSIFRIDKLFNVIEISQGKVITFTGDVFFDYLATPVITSTTNPNEIPVVYACFADGQHIYVYNESTNAFDIITDPNAPINPTYIATFGNRLVAAGANTTQFSLSEINLAGGLGGTFDPAKAFTINNKAVFAQEDSVIRQFGVIHNTLYIFKDYTTGIWSDKPSTFTSTGGVVNQFPWSKNKTFSWDYGIADPLSLDVDFGMMAWLGQNRNGLFQVMVSQGDQPKDISSQAVDVLFQKAANLGGVNPFLSLNSDGFLYVYENTVFYRLSAGEYVDTDVLDFINQSNSIEYNFNTQTWHRCIEKNGERNRIQKHVFFNQMHIVTVNNDNALYEMRGDFYDNDILNPAQEDHQAADAFIREPFRYERVTPIIYEEGYAEFLTEYVEIDFVWGELTFHDSTNPFTNTTFIIDEEPAPGGGPLFCVTEQLGPDGDVVYMITEQGNFPVLDSTTYHTWFKPHIELYFSDDGGVSFFPADVMHFSDLGVYQWRMRWYQLGPSRNRCYKLVCVSPAPIVILGGVMMTKRISGGSY